MIRPRCFEAHRTDKVTPQYRGQNLSLYNLLYNLHWNLSMRKVSPQPTLNRQLTYWNGIRIIEVPNSGVQVFAIRLESKAVRPDGTLKEAHEIEFVHSPSENAAILPPSESAWPNDDPESDGDVEHITKRRRVS